MAVDAADIEQMRRQGPDWRHRDDKRLMGSNPDAEKPHDPYDKVVKERMAEEDRQARPPAKFEAAPRRSLLGRVLGKFGF